MPGRIAGSLQAGEDIEFQRRQWTAERIGWAVMAVLILLALVGLFGKGPVSSAAVEAGTISVEYERFARLEGPSEIGIAVDGAAAEEGAVEIVISGDYIRGVEITGITPQPDTETFGDDLHLVFGAPEAETVRVTLQLQPTEIGPRAAEVAVAGGDSVELWQWVHP